MVTAVNSVLDGQEVTHAVGLGTQILLIDRVRRHLQRHTLDDFDAPQLECALLERVIGQQSYAVKPEVKQDGGSGRVVAPVNRQPECQVGVDGVEAAVLQGVRANLVSQADAAAFLTQVQQHARLSLREELQRRGELFAAVATHRAKHVASQ